MRMQSAMFESSTALWALHSGQGLQLGLQANRSPPVQSLAQHRPSLLPLSCQDNWSGGDCSVSLNASCLAGTRRAAKRPDQRGTCWQECACDEAGKECRCGRVCLGYSLPECKETQQPAVPCN